MTEVGTKRTVRIVISGRVQGVGFRYFTRRAAERRGLVGWVKNLPSGEVEVRVMGEPSVLETFSRQLRLGPPGSQVTGLSESELKAPEELSSFQIVY